jgi:hypothetical protein
MNIFPSKRRQRSSSMEEKNRTALVTAGASLNIDGGFNA